MKFNNSKFIIYNSTLLLFLSLLLFTSCEKGTEPEKKKPESLKWKLVAEFENRDIRYMIKFKDELYISTINPTLQFEDAEKSEIFKSSDGENFRRVKTFPNIIGPMAIMEDTLCVIHRDSIYAFNNQKGWWGKYETPDYLSEPESDTDLIYFEDNLYGMVSTGSTHETWKISKDGNAEQIFPLYNRSRSGSKFIKLVNNNIEFCYLRGSYLASGFYQFKEENFIKLSEGLTENERYAWNPPNSIAVKNNVLYAGFQNPSTVKKLVNDVWITVTDTLLNSINAYEVKPPLISHTLGIAFYNERMFVSTLDIGVIEWTTDGWKRIITKGLLKATGQAFEKLQDVYVPITSFEIFNGKLIVAYGKPGYAPYRNIADGVLTMDIDEIEYFDTEKQ